MVVWLAVEFTTVKANGLNIDDYNYQYYCETESDNTDYRYIVAISNYELDSLYTSGEFKDLNNNLLESLPLGDYLGYKYRSNKPVYDLNFYVLVYSDVNGWICKLPWIGNTTSNNTTYLADGYLYDNFTEKIPTSMPEVVITDLKSAINEAINNTTNTYNEATSIYNTIKNNYTLYQKGDIDKATMQANLTQAINQLNELNNNTGNTLADLMAINNALTYAQTIQQELLLKPSSSVTTSVQTILQAVSNLVKQYQSGTVTQEQTMQELRGYAYQLAQLLTTDISISDVEVINTGTNVINNFIEIISNNSEFNKDVSDRSQLSDQEELDFIESIETEKSVEDLAPSKIYIQGQASTTDNNTGETLTDLFNAVWNNAIVRIMVPIFAGFSVIAVVFGRKYKL